MTNEVSTFDIQALLDRYHSKVDNMGQRNRVPIQQFHDQILNKCRVIREGDRK
jgi:hypothetical protein